MKYIYRDIYYYDGILFKVIEGYEYQRKQQKRINKNICYRHLLTTLFFVYAPKCFDVFRDENRRT